MFEDDNDTPPAADTTAPDPIPATPPAPAPAPASTKPAETPWYKARIDELTAKLHRANEELTQSRQTPPASTSGPAPTAPVATPVFDQSAFDRAVSAEAQRRTVVNEFTARCDTCVGRGREAFGATEFDGRVRALRTLVDDKDPDSSTRYNGLLSAAFETGADAEIVHELGGDLDRAMRLLSMPPMKMAVELARMADNLRGERPPAREPGPGTNAPPPVRPVGSRGAQHSPIAPDDADRADSLSDSEWIRRRNAQVTERQKQGIIIQ